MKKIIVLLLLGVFVVIFSAFVVVSTRQLAQEKTVLAETLENNTKDDSLIGRVEVVEKAYKDILARLTQTVTTTTYISKADSSKTLTLSALPNGFLRSDSKGLLSSSQIDLEKDVTRTLPVSSGGTGLTSFSPYGLVYGNSSSNLATLSPGSANYILASNGESSAPTWIPYPTLGSSFNTLTVGTSNPFSIANTGKISLAFSGDSGYLSSNGGAFFMNNTSNIGTGIGIYSNAGSEAVGNMINVKVDNPNYSQAAFYMNYDGNSNAVEIVGNGNDTSSNALAVTGNNILDSTVGIIGSELNRGTVKISHYRPTGGTDSNASALSIDLKGVGTRAQGVYVDSTETGGTLGNLLRLRNTSIDKFVVDYQGNVSAYGNIVQGAYGTDTTYTKYGNTTNDQFFIGTTGAFRVQRAVSNSEAFRVQIAGDTQGRWRGTSDGSLQWGDGSSAQDVILKRSSAGTLTLTGAMVLNNANNSYNTVVKGVTDSNLLYVDAATDRIGIGTSSPTAPLHINKNSLGNAAFIINQLGNGNILTASSAGAAVLTLDRSGNLRTIGSLCVKASINTACAGSTPGTIYASNTTVQSADLAENYISSQTLESGDVVMPANDGNDQAVIKAHQQYQHQVLGIVSTKPGVTLNSDAQTDASHPGLYPIALQGRVPLKVNASGGNISVGDLLTTSSTPGVAMKASGKGFVVAKALEAYSSDDPKAIGKIMVFIANTFYAEDEIKSTLSQSTSGQITIPAGQTETELKISGDKDARVFLEPEDVPIATSSKKKSDGIYGIKIAQPQSQDLILNWWLVK